MTSPADHTTARPQDVSLRYLFDDADIRGETVHLDQAFQDILAIHQHAPAVSLLLGEFLAAAVLLSTTLKFDGKLILQVRSEGQIPLLMVECTSDLQLRAIVRGAEQASSDNFHQLLANGQLAITVDPAKGQRYQSVVPLAGDSLADSLNTYFEQSEQLRTRFWLAADTTQAAGMLLQQLPSQLTTDPTERQQQWEHSCSLAATIDPSELLGLATEQLLYRLYHQDAVRLYEPAAVEFQCSCSAERTIGALATLEPAELEEILREQGEITMDCEFCNQQYAYRREDLAALLNEDESRTLH